MKILALEFSSPLLSVAVVQGDGRGNALTTTELAEANARSSNALGLIEKALSRAQIEREQIDCLAIGLGPGSYSGIRSAIAISQGWQLARSLTLNLLGLSSVDCIAAQAQAEGIYGRADVVIDAQRNEFYLSAYELTAENRRETEPLRLATLAETQAVAQSGGTIIGPEVTKWFPEGRVILPRAVTLGKMALRSTDFVPGEKLEPVYLRQISFVKAPPPRTWPGQSPAKP